MDAKDLEAIRQIIKEETDEIRQELNEIKQETQKICTRLEAVENETRKVHIMVETAVNPNIKVIVEGHLDLSRKLDDSLKINNEKEMMKIRLNILESEMKILKEQAAQTI